MENNNFPLSQLSSFSNEDLQRCLFDILDLLNKRYNNHLINLQHKDEIFSIFMNIKSKLFAISNKLLKQSLDPTKYTPMRGNQLSVALLMNDYVDFLPYKKQFLNDFIQKFWTTTVI